MPIADFTSHENIFKKSTRQHLLSIYLISSTSTVPSTCKFHNKPACLLHVNLLSVTVGGRYVDELIQNNYN